AEIDGLEEALDTRADVDVLEALRLADEIQIDGHVALDDRRDVDLWRGRRSRRRLLARAIQRARRDRGDEHRASCVRPHLTPFPSGSTRHSRSRHAVTPAAAVPAR